MKVSSARSLGRGPLPVAGVGVAFLAATIFAFGGCAADDQSPSRSVVISDLVRADHYTALVFELDSVAGAEPEQAAQTRVVEMARSLVDKPDGISVVHDETLDSHGADHAWTQDELHALEAETRNLALEPGAVGVHVLAVDGHAQNDSPTTQTLGLSWNPPTIVLFTQTIGKNCSGSSFPNALVVQLCEEGEELVWLHELGHLLGLVHLGLPMQHAHEDPDHPGHCDNPDCIMYWAFHRGSAIDHLRDRFGRGQMQVPLFDQACLNDLAALRD